MELGSHCQISPCVPGVASAAAVPRSSPESPLPTTYPPLAAMSAAAPAESGESSGDGGEITYVSYGGEQHLPLVMSLVDAELSEPYSIFTYRYFVYLWPQLTFLEGKCVGTVVCKMGEHRGAFRGYIAMLVVLKPYRGRGIGEKRRKLEEEKGIII